jgi:hypothetical protein
MLIETSHESPVSMLDRSLDYNDYGYALVHLFETHPEYYKFYKRLVDETDTPVLLDNSIFELGKSFDPVKYSDWIDKLQPNYYIVPDVLESARETIQKWKDWNVNYNDSTDALKIGVVQGETWNDLLECYKFMRDNADYIAISFDYSYYNYTGRIINDNSDHKLQLWCTGRQRFIRQLIDEGHWDWNKPHHLLGCSLAREFRWYVDKDVYNIKSCDTSNPVVAAIKGCKYNDEMGLTHKPSTMLAELIDYEMHNEEKLHLLEYNTRMFKKIIRRT